MMAKAGIRAWAWLLAMAFAVVLLERGVPHHCSAVGHHDLPSSSTASLAAQCALCDLALPTFETVAPAVGPKAPCTGPQDLASIVFGTKHGDLPRLPVRGPPIA